MSERKTILVVGAGDATGGAIAKRFAREGYVACVARRNAEKLVPLVAEIEAAGGSARAFGCDARVEEQVVELFATIEREVGPLHAVVFNIGANVQFSITETTERVYRKVWEMAALAGFLTGREAAKVMLPRGQGTIIFTGATASLRGRANFSAFASAKFALRALAQSMARELGPMNIHVAHVVIGRHLPLDLDLYAMAAEPQGDIGTGLRAMAGRRLRGIHRQNDDLPGRLQERQGAGRRAGRLAAGIPAQHYLLARWR